MGDSAELGPLFFRFSKKEVIDHDLISKSLQDLKESFLRNIHLTELLHSLLPFLLFL
jgi:hypothetical protein